MEKIKFTEELFKEFAFFVDESQHCFMTASDIIKLFGKIPESQELQFKWDYMDWLRNEEK